MKRSVRISLRLVPIVSAAFLAACGSTPEQRACVDKDGKVVAEVNCATLPPNGASGSFDSTPPPGSTASHGSGFYRWYWFRGAGLPSIGSFAPQGGQYTSPGFRSSGTSSGGSHSATTTRGGFGATASGSSMGS